MKKDIKQPIWIDPFETTVNDYHGFSYVVDHFKDAGIKLKYKEVGYCVKKHAYCAVFYQNLKEALPLINKLRKKYEDI